jgi:predicted outer membrane repeat protein
VNNVDFENGTSTVTNGGAIYNAGTLTLNRVEISNNSTLGFGGGIYTAYDGSIPSSLILNYSSIHGNSATASGGKGGGIYNDSGSVDLDSSEIGYNDAYSDGGGLWSTGGYWVTFVDSQIHHNTSQHGSGGNIFNRGPMTIEKTYINYGSAYVDGGNIYSGVAGPGGSILEITRSVISHGTAGGNGGGIANDGILDLTNVSFYWNISPTGAGLYTSEPVSTIALDHVTMSGNLTGLSGAYNIYNSAPANPVLVNNSILDAGISTGCVGAVALASSYNIDSGTSCGLPGGLHNQSGIDPLLGIFADHGGITDTFSLSINSPAVDWIPVGVNGCGTMISEDQRGVIRPLDGNRDGTNGCDVGAYELQLMHYLPAIMK